jgi:hypothetical protein
MKIDKGLSLEKINKDQHVHKQVFTIANNQGNAHQNHLTPVIKMANIFKVLERMQRNQSFFVLLVEIQYFAFLKD